MKLCLMIEDGPDSSEVKIGRVFLRMGIFNGNVGNINPSTKTR